MADPQNAGHPAGTQAQGNGNGAGETLLAGKYKTPQDLESAYKELEGKLGGYKDLEAKAKIADMYSQYGDPNNVIEWAKYGASEYQKRGSKPAAESKPAAAVNDLLQDWELLPPREQANRLKELTAGELREFTKKQVEEYASPHVNRATAAIDNLTKQWDIYRKIMSATRSNPNADPEKLLQTMVSVATGNQDDLLQLAMKMTTGDLDAETKAKGLFEAWKADEETKRKNAQFASLTGSTSGPFKKAPDAPKTAEDANTMALRSLLERGVISSDQV